jgi:hypothetical protein
MVYPTQEEVREWFRLQETGQSPLFFERYVSDEVVWTVEVCLRGDAGHDVGNASYRGDVSVQGGVYGRDVS